MIAAITLFSCSKKSTLHNNIILKIKENSTQMSEILLSFK